jgi:phage tail sheath protein FI
MTMLRLVVERQAQWLVFEPHTPEVRRQLREVLVQLLRELQRSGAFAGGTEHESFFVRCDETVNPSWTSGLGRLVAEVGVAPAQPLEYLVLRVAQDAEGMVRIDG